MSFSLKFSNNRVINVIIDTIASIIDETRFKLSSDGFVIVAIDQSGICLLKLIIDKDKFQEYKCDKDFNIWLNIDGLDKILKRSSSQDSIELSYKEKDNKIKIKMERPGPSQKTLTRTFSLSLLQTEEEEISIDGLFEIEYNSTWEIEPDFLVEAIRDAEIYSEILNIKAIENEGLQFTSIGEMGEMEYNLDLEDLTIQKIEESCTGSYSLTFLKAILKLTSIEDVKVDMSLKTDHPLKIIFDMDEGGELSFFLAPRVEDEDIDEDEYDTDEF